MLQVRDRGENGCIARHGPAPAWWQGNCADLWPVGRAITLPLVAKESPVEDEQPLAQIGAVVGAIESRLRQTQRAARCRAVADQPSAFSDRSPMTMPRPRLARVIRRSVRTRACTFSNSTSASSLCVDRYAAQLSIVCDSPLPATSRSRSPSDDAASAESGGTPRGWPPPRSRRRALPPTGATRRACAARCHSPAWRSPAAAHGAGQRGPSSAIVWPVAISRSIPSTAVIGP